MQEVQSVLHTDLRTGDETVFEFCRRDGIGTMRNVDEGTGFTAADTVWEAILNYHCVGESRSRQEPGAQGFKPDYQWTVEGGTVLIEYIPVPKREFNVPLKVMRDLLNLFYKKIPA